ncbi:hypothetical protein M422DRAFT_51378 [Sphaerobolus stellatus SS14]|uniref:Arrestin-like N-terminal domain-containing protein n=1 Tax=Sphaerobolus stellatus (strain SS14) TaxID=990650 RepID=A0A0C9V288_SPHS4|nr:hypothetical protein M422DRAFT_51378 [Sphaerobolus stellatus SS14]
MPPAVSITITPVDTSIDMFESPDTSSAYSLSGDILIKLESRSSRSLQVTSLELTFEGQSELILAELGYAPLRVFTLNKELVSASHPIILSAHEDSWRLAFNLVIPGWLPATDVFGDDNDPRHSAGTSYALHATAVVSEVDGASSSSRALGKIRSAVKTKSKPQAVVAQKVPIYVSRYASYPTQEYDADEDPSSPVFPSARYSVQAQPDTKANIPESILRSLQMTAILPQKISMDDNTIPFTLRIKSNVEEKIRRRLRIIGMETDIKQMERYTTAPTGSYVRSFPVPPPSHQPPSVPLRAPHPASTLRDMGLMKPATPEAKHVIREHSLFPHHAAKTAAPSKTALCA